VNGRILKAEEFFRIVKGQWKRVETIENPDEIYKTERMLFAKAIPVWYQNNGRVNTERLSICKEEHNKMTKHRNQFKETLYTQVNRVSFDRTTKLNIYFT
jgi:hypothetical protein